MGNRMNEENLAAAIIAMEKAALEEWNRGNPTGYLDIYAENITYFDPIQRINGFEKIKELYESIRGKLQVEKYEIIDPVVQVSGNTVVLGYILVSHAENKVYRWNCTEVYQQQSDKQWKIIHSHWSLGKTEQEVE
jgi:ketosteroid isomerase-like protein